MNLSGQQKSEQNFIAFMRWSESKTDAEFRAMVVRGQLNRENISKECDFAKSVLAQNPRVKEALKTLEHALRLHGILPPLAEVGPSNEPLPPIGDTQRVMVDKARLKRLESENASLRSELTQLRADMAKYAMMERFMAETGRLPR